MPYHKTSPDTDSETEQYPIEPRYHPIHKVTRTVYDFLASAKLAMALLVVILICCLTGVTILRGEQAWKFIFSSIWFNAILVVLVINVACCFFGRIWGRKVTVISFGMILFHLSFVCMSLGIVYNSLFYFRGNIRLTEGEALPSGDPASYDNFEKGRFFDFSRNKGETRLNSVHIGYKAGDDDKRAAYDVTVGEGNERKQGVIYITHKLTYKGFDYFNDKEGFSLLVDLFDTQGRKLYAAHVPLQSIKQQDASYIYATGYTDEKRVVKPEAVLFPHEPASPKFGLLLGYYPSKLVNRGGEARFTVYSIDGKMALSDKPVFDGQAKIGDKISAGDYLLSAREVRYWVGMLVRYEPGKPIVLTSLWVGLAGMIITTIGRVVRSSR